jgi:hypothetical protein
MVTVAPLSTRSGNSSSMGHLYVQPAILLNTCLPAVGCNVYISEGRKLQLIHRLEVTVRAHTWTQLTLQLSTSSLTH